mgnify:FL=1
MYFIRNLNTENSVTKRAQMKVTSEFSPLEIILVFEVDDYVALGYTETMSTG